MRFPPRCIGLLGGFLILAGLGPATFAAPPADTYDSQVAAARAFSAEGSHALAQKAFAAARQLAQADEQRRWCNLWSLEEAVAPNATPPASVEKDLQDLLSAYGEGKEGRDGFWAEARELEARLADHNWQTQPRAAEIRLDVATFWSGHVPSPEASARFGESLVALGRQITQEYWNLDENTFATGRALLRTGGRTIGDAALRARVQLLYAQSLEARHDKRVNGQGGTRRPPFGEQDEITAAYDAAVLSAKDTPVSAEALVARAKWEAGLPLTKAADPAATQFTDAGAYKRRLALIDEALAAGRPAGFGRDFDQSLVILRQTRKRLSTPTVRIVLEKAFLPESPIPIYAYVQHAREIELRLHPLDLRQLAQAAACRTTDEMIAAAEAYRPTRVWSRPTGIPVDLGYAVSSFPMPEKLKPGAYVLIARDTADQTVADAAIFLVTRTQAMADAGDATGFSLYAFDQGTGKLIPNLHGFICAGSHIATFSLPSIDQKRAGSSFVDFPFWLAPNESPATAIAGEAGGQPFLIRKFRNSRYLQENQWEFLLASDRPLYLPGETALWKITARSLSGGQLKVPEGLHLQVRANASFQQKLGTWDITLNRFGTASGSLPIPAQQPATPVTFEISGSDAGEEIHTWVQAFSIDRFRAPESQLEISTDPDQIQRAAAGGEMSVTITARYFTGEPISQAKLDITSSFSTDWRWESARRRGGPNNPWNRKSEVSAVTDANGRALVPIELPADAPPAFQVAIEVRHSAGGDQSQAKVEFRILPHGYTARLHSGDSESIAPSPFPNPGSANRAETPVLYATPGHAVLLALSARDGRDSPAIVHGKVDIYRRDWEEVWRRPEGGFLTGDALALEKSRSFDWPPRDPQGEKSWELIQSGYRTNLIETLPVATGADGNARFQSLPMAASCYQIVFTPAGEQAADPDDPFAELEVLVADDKSPNLHCKPEFAPRVIPCSPFQTVGQPVRALVVLPVAGRTVLLQASGMSTSSSQVEWFSGNAAIVEFPWKPVYWAGVGISATLLSPDGGRVGWARMPISRASNSLQVTLHPDPSQPRPGEKARLQLRLSDEAGHPVSGEASIAVADASVAALVSGGRPSPATVFLKEASFYANGMDSSPRSSLFVKKSKGGPSPNGTLSNGGSFGEIGDFVTLTPFAITKQQMSFPRANTLSGTQLSAESLAAPMLVENVSFSAEAGPPVHVRSQFSYTAFWQPDVAFGPDGTAAVDFAYPENLTAWQIDVSAVSDGNRFGVARATTRTDLPFQARLRAPRAIVAGDTASVYGVLVNTRSAEMQADVRLASNAPASVSLDAGGARSATVPAAGESTLAWTLHGQAPGEAQLTLTARAGSDADGMQLKLPVREDGFDQQTGVTGRLTDHPLNLELTLPDPIDPRRSAVDVHVSSGITPALIESLPYLIDYPYGCVEQTMSRFLPAIVVVKTLRDSGFNPDEIDRRVIARSAPGRRSPAGLDKLDDVVAASLSRLIDAQLPNGAFGWWPDGAPDPYMTAYVLRGLNIAAALGMDLPWAMHANVFAAVVRMLKETEEGGRSESPQKLAWELSAAAAYPGSIVGEQRQILDRTNALLYEERAKLTAAGLALLACSAHDLGSQTEIPVLLRNLENGVARGQSAELGETAQWGESGNFFDGLDGPVETTALCLEALLQIDPRHPLVDPAANWLLVNRQSGHWMNTRDTALALLALNHYAQIRGDAAADGGYRLGINGHSVAERRFDRDSILEPASFAIDPALLQPGRNVLTLERSDGKTPCYLVATANNWALSGRVQASGSFLRVGRSFFRLVEQPTLGGAIHLESEAISTGVATALDERVECRLVIETLHDVDYVMVESPKPGGFEPLNPVSGWDARMQRLEAGQDRAGENGTDGAGQRVYRDEHDDRSVFFLQHLPAGRWEIRYRMRSAFAGDFRALPATAIAMYVPVLAANSTAERVGIHP